MELPLKKVDKEAIQGAQDVFEIIQKLFYKRPKKVDLLKEHFWTIALNRASKILLVELVSIGSNGRTVVEPQEVFRLPLYKAASQLILVHNHPSGGLNPSESDLNITNRLIQVGLIMNIEVLDHVIVTENSYHSFLISGLMEKLRWDRKYALTFVRDKQVAKEIEKIKKDAKKHKQLSRQEGKLEGIKLGKQAGARQRNKVIAKQMLKKGLDINLVQELTGITKQWLGRLKSELQEEK